MKQQSAEWLNWRKGGIGASEAPVITGDSPWLTPLQLWEQKLGLSQPRAKNPAMLRGLMLEPLAREAYEAYTGNIMEPHCRIHPGHEFMLASLDGISLEGDLILEIKCPGAEDHQAALAGRIPQKYQAQIQHQLSVTGAQACHYWSFDGRDGVLVEVTPDGSYIRDLIEVEQEFWQQVLNREPPQAGSQDRHLRSDEDWIASARAWQDAKLAMDQARVLEAEARARLETLAEPGITVGGGVRLAKVYRKGTVDYSRIPALAGLDLDPFRKPGNLVCSISRTGSGLDT